MRTDIDVSKSGIFSPDEQQAIVWLLRTDRIGPGGRLCRDVEALSPCVHLPSLKAGRNCVVAYDTMTGVTRAEFELDHLSRDWLAIQTPLFVTDLARVIRRVK